MKYPLAIIVLLVALPLGGCRTGPPPTDAPDARVMVRTELYFGLGLPDGGVVSDAQWEAFVRDEITPRFPDGLTVLAAQGQWREGQTLVREPSRILVLYHDGGDEPIEAIRRVYRERFGQTSVLRVDDRVRVAF